MNEVKAYSASVLGSLEVKTDEEVQNMCVFFTCSASSVASIDGSSVAASPGRARSSYNCIKLNTG